jgi:hypothetical protein
MASAMNKPHEIVHCTCVHKYQDAKYGVGNRVANYARNANNKQGGYRCTVCERVH